ncbi:phospholipase/carboxylesterase [Prauserella shujinwangii]|uniref:Phospholipase/carboxylesterase n=1 Tax=Prauserella shujinwangii TaxID=1453103 RepID=A0A2T0LZL4_9PSEU|nr:phospholipase [Prauserella shujinwangii]PRX49565.1 phospholipase/carboxylesterase [Prauserella shujinwangii]
MSTQRRDGLPVTQWGVDAGDAALAVLAVHGRAQGPSFLRETARRFGAAPVRFYAPEAEGNTWYPRPFLEPLASNQPDLDESLATVDGYLAALAGAGFPPERVVPWGFSQGACLLAHHVLTAPRRFAGLVLCTGGHVGPDPLPPPAGTPLRGVPAVVRSVEDDPWVPSHRVRETAELLRRAGADVDLRIDPGTEHVITDEACAAATRLLVATAARAGPR